MSLITIDDYITGTYDPNAPFNREDVIVETVCDGCLRIFPEDEVERSPLSGNWYCPECMEEEKKAALDEEAASK